MDAVVEVACGVIAEFEARLKQFETRITKLERRRNKNSSNSSKPPSSDGLKRTKHTNSLRSKNSGRKPGGQPRQTLVASESPDVTVNMPLNSCPECCGDLSDQPAQSEETRQVFDLPDIKMIVTEFLAESKT